MLEQHKSRWECEQPSTLMLALPWRLAIGLIVITIVGLGGVWVSKVESAEGSQCMNSHIPVESSDLEELVEQTPRSRAEEHRRIAEDHPELLKQKKTKKSEKRKKVMVKTLSTTAKIVITVFVTLTAVASYAGVFYSGTQFQQHINDQIAEQSKHIAQSKQ